MLAPLLLVIIETYMEACPPLGNVFDSGYEACHRAHTQACLAADITVAVYFCVLALTSTSDKSNVGVGAFATVSATHAAVDSC